MPFTSPVLAGARVRSLDRKCDLVVPHPGGARGVYIFAMASLTEFCAPTLHDLQLADRLLNVRTITPAGIRAAARAAAMQGLAGRDAAAAAAAAEASDESARLAVQTSLLSQGFPQSAGTASNPAENSRLAIRTLAASTGSSPEQVKDSLDQLCAQIVSVGLAAPGPAPERSEAGRCANLLHRLSDMERTIRAWLETNGDCAPARQVADAVRSLCAAGRVVLADTNAVIADTPGLLAAWAAEPERLAHRLARPDWLLDGWEHICLLWCLAEDNARAEALAEACVILPPFPPEGEAWLANAPAVLPGLRGRPATSPMQRAGGRMPSEIVSLIARNERIRAMSA